MRHWNYRVVKRSVEGPHGFLQSFGIHEVFYDEAGKPESVSINPVGIMADSLEEVETELAMQAEALRSDVLDYNTIPVKE